ncbi:MAG: LysR family transcriptional regulator, partial [Gemmatimonadetes bacterium]|nr:LysR family transcriptional regulator [Gemmatimonadota bacterium]
TYRVGIIPSVGPYLLPEVAADLRHAFPRLGLLWLEEKTGLLMRQLEQGELDAAVVALEAKLPNVASAVIARDPFVVAAAPEHPLVRGNRRREPSELATARALLLDDGHCLRDQALNLCAAAGTQEEDFRATSLSTLVQMVAHDSTTVTILPRLAVGLENRAKSLRVRRFTDPEPFRTLALVWRPSDRHGPVFESLAQQMAASYPGNS